MLNVRGTPYGVPYFVRRYPSSVIMVATLSEQIKFFPFAVEDILICSNYSVLAGCHIADEGYDTVTVLY